MLNTLLFFSIKICQAQNRDSRISIHLDQAKKYQANYPDSSLYYGNKAFEIASELNDFWAMGKSKAIEGRMKVGYNNDLEAVVNYLEAIDFLMKADTLDAFLNYTIFKNIAVVQHDYGLFKEAVSYYDSAKVYLKKHLIHHPEEARKYRDDKLLYRIDFFRAENKYRSNDLDGARTLLFELLNNSDTPSNIRLIALNKLGVILGEAGDIEGAIETFQIIIGDEDVENVSLARALHNIGYEHLRDKNYELALEYYLRSVDVNLKAGNELALFFNFMDIGETYIEVAESDKALGYLNMAISLNVEIDSEPDRYKIYELLGIASIDQFPSEAKNHWKKYRELEKQTEGIAELLNIENKSREFRSVVNGYLKQKEYQQEIEAEARMSQRNYIMMVLGVIIMLTFIILGIKYKDRLKRRRHHQEMINTRLID